MAAMIPGSDPKLKDEAVIFSAHWDHLGVGTPVNGDSDLQRRDRQRHRLRHPAGIGARLGRAAAEAEALGVLFLAVTAEEGGLRGSEYYAAHPLIPLAKTAIDLNYDALYPWGRAARTW